MIQFVTFILILTAALIFEGSSLPLWPLFLSTAVLVTLILVLGKQFKRALATSIMAFGVLVMLIQPNPEIWVLLSVAYWTFTSATIWYLGFTWASRLILIMPVGYALLFVYPDHKGLWVIIEASWVVALLLAGGKFHETFIGLVTSAIDSFRSPSSRRFVSSRRRN